MSDLQDCKIMYLCYLAIKYIVICYLAIGIWYFFHIPLPLHTYYYKCLKCLSQTHLCGQCLLILQSHLKHPTEAFPNSDRHNCPSLVLLLHLVYNTTVALICVFIAMFIEHLPHTRLRGIDSIQACADRPSLTISSKVTLSTLNHFLFPESNYFPSYYFPICGTMLYIY